MGMAGKKMGFGVLVLCNSQYWVWGVLIPSCALIALLDVAEGACFGPTSWSGTDLHQLRGRGV